MAGRFGETLGQYLRRERESRSVSLEELSKNTRIGLAFLESLERDDFDFFAQREFILGFLKGYARHLGLEVEEVLRRYRIQAELMSRKETFKQIPLFPHRADPAGEVQESKPDLPGVPILQGRKPFPWKIFLQIATVVVAVGLSLYIHHLLRNTERTPPTEKALTEKVGKESSAPQENFRPEKKEGAAGIQGEGKLK